LESSPLNRVLGQKSPGAWNTHPTENAYQTNVSSDIIAYFYVNSSNQLVKGTNYAVGTLFVTKAKDEDHKESYEFKDKLGQVVMIPPRCRAIVSRGKSDKNIVIQKSKCYKE